MSCAGILCFTDRGETLARKISSQLDDCLCVRPEKGMLMDTAAHLFCEKDALIFIGACGIAVRAIAPLVASKTQDPAVIVMDEEGRHVISLLSGHIGGANDLARRLAGFTGGEAIITTATDINRRFSVDAWAARNGLVMDSMEAVRTFASQILKRDLPICSDFEIRGFYPPGTYSAERGACGAHISCRVGVNPFDCTLHLIPSVLHVGIGCKRGTSVERIGEAVHTALKKGNLDARAVCALASIDVKKDEQGLLKYADENKLRLSLYSAEELCAIEGSFASSSFVQNIVGVDNVCERAAVASAGTGAQLLVHKTILGGVTIAIAQEKWRVCFE